MSNILLFLLQKVLGDGLNKDDKEGLSLQSTFIQNWLHALITKLPVLKESNQVPHAVAISVTCCKRYVQLQEHLTPDRKCIVAQLVCHMLQAMQDKVPCMFMYCVQQL